MKKITCLFFTFLGICCSLAQTLVQKADTIAVKEKAGVRIYPNPSKNKVEIKIRGFEAGFVKIQLLTSAGKLLGEQKRLVLGGNEGIVYFFSEKPGLYFLLLKQGKILVKTRLVMQ